MPRLSSAFTALVRAGAAVVFFLPPPQAIPVNAMHAAALLVVFSIAVLLPLDYLWWRLIGYIG